MVEGNLSMANRIGNGFRPKYFDTKLCPVCGKDMIVRDLPTKYLTVADFRCIDKKCRFNNQFNDN